MWLLLMCNVHFWIYASIEFHFFVSFIEFILLKLKWILNGMIVQMLMHWPIFKCKEDVKTRHMHVSTHLHTHNKTETHTWKNKRTQSIPFINSEFNCCWFSSCFSFRYFWTIWIERIKRRKRETRSMHACAWEREILKTIHTVKSKNK